MNFNNNKKPLKIIKTEKRQLFELNGWGHMPLTKEMTMSRSKQNKDAPPKAIKKGESKKHDERKKKHNCSDPKSLKP